MYDRAQSWWRLGLPAAIVSVALALHGDASARASFDSPYTPEQTFQAAVRYVRIDLGLKVSEKDAAAGYVLFEYKARDAGDRASAGSIEFVPSGQGVHVVVQLAQLPRYHEQVLADGLQRKMRDEYGEVPKPRPAPAPSATPPEGSAKPDRTPPSESH